MCVCVCVCVCVCIYLFIDILIRPVGWGSRIHRLHLYRVFTTPPTISVLPQYDKKRSDGEFPEMWELRGMGSTSSLTSFPGLLWPGVVDPDRVLSMGQMELNHGFESLQFLYLN